MSIAEFMSSSVKGQVCVMVAVKRDAITGGRGAMVQRMDARQLRRVLQGMAIDSDRLAGYRVLCSVK
jgi:hypothetical protein